MDRILLGNNAAGGTVIVIFLALIRGQMVFVMARFFLSMVIMKTLSIPATIDTPIHMLVRGLIGEPESDMT